MRRGLISAIAIGCAIVVASRAEAGIWCGETVTQVIAHSNCKAYFTTNATCPNWRMIDWVSQAAVNQTFSLMLSSMMTGRSVTLLWPNLTSCTQTNVVYAVPESVIMPR